MSDKTKKCKNVYDWHIKRLTRKPNKINKIILHQLKTKKEKKLFIKYCVKPKNPYDHVAHFKNENDFNKHMDAYDKVKKNWRTGKIKIKNATRKVKNIFK
jgi:hypothetical protein